MDSSQPPGPPKPYPLPPEGEAVGDRTQADDPPITQSTPATVEPYSNTDITSRNVSLSQLAQQANETSTYQPDFETLKTQFLELSWPKITITDKSKKQYVDTCKEKWDIFNDKKTVSPEEKRKLLARDYFHKALFAERFGDSKTAAFIFGEACKTNINVIDNELKLCNALLAVSNGSATDSHLKALEQHAVDYSSYQASLALAALHTSLISIPDFSARPHLLPKTIFAMAACLEDSPIVESNFHSNLGMAHALRQQHLLPSGTSDEQSILLSLLWTPLAATEKNEERKKLPTTTHSDLDSNQLAAMSQYLALFGMPDENSWKEGLSSQLMQFLIERRKILQRTAEKTHSSFIKSLAMTLVGCAYEARLGPPCLYNKLAAESFEAAATGHPDFQDCYAKAAECYNSAGYHLHAAQCYQTLSQQLKVTQPELFTHYSELAYEQQEKADQVLAFLYDESSPKLHPDRVSSTESTRLPEEQSLPIPLKDSASALTTDNVQLPTEQSATKVSISSAVANETHSLSAEKSSASSSKISKRLRKKSMRPPLTKKESPSVQEHSVNSTNLSQNTATAPIQAGLERSLSSHNFRFLGPPENWNSMTKRSLKGIHSAIKNDNSKQLENELSKAGLETPNTSEKTFIYIEQAWFYMNQCSLPLYARPTKNKEGISASIDDLCEHARTSLMNALNNLCGQNFSKNISADKLIDRLSSYLDAIPPDTDSQMRTRKLLRQIMSSLGHSYSFQADQWSHPRGASENTRAFYALKRRVDPGYSKKLEIAYPHSTEKIQVVSQEEFERLKRK